MNRIGKKNDLLPAFLTIHQKHLSPARLEDCEVEEDNVNCKNGE